MEKSYLGTVNNETISIIAGKDNASVSIQDKDGIYYRSIPVVEQKESDIEKLQGQFTQLIADNAELKEEVALLRTSLAANSKITQLVSDNAKSKVSIAAINTTATQLMANNTNSKTLRDIAFTE